MSLIVSVDRQRRRTVFSSRNHNPVTYSPTTPLEPQVGPRGTSPGTCFPRKPHESAIKSRKKFPASETEFTSNSNEGGHDLTLSTFIGSFFHSHSPPATPITIPLIRIAVNAVNLPPRALHNRPGIISFAIFPQQNKTTSKWPSNYSAIVFRTLGSFAIGQ